MAAVNELNLIYSGTTYTSTSSVESQLAIFQYPLIVGNTYEAYSTPSQTVYAGGGTSTLNSETGKYDVSFSTAGQKTIYMLSDGVQIGWVVTAVEGVHWQRTTQTVEVGETVHISLLDSDNVVFNAENATITANTSGKVSINNGGNLINFTGEAVGSTSISFSQTGYTCTNTLTITVVQSNSRIASLKDNNDKILYPITKAGAVVTEDNQTVENKLASKAKITVSTTDIGEGADMGDTDLYVVPGCFAVDFEDLVWENILSKIYPVGSIYISTTLSTASDVASALGGGTWEAWGSGRVPVGVDTSQTEFDTSEETGGSKTHRHSADNMEALIGSSYGNATALGFAQSSNLDTGTTFPSTYSVGGSTSAASGHPKRSHNTKVLGETTYASTLQPYITCYMYKRTA